MGTTTTTIINSTENLQETTYLDEGLDSSPVKNALDEGVATNLQASSEKAPTIEDLWARKSKPLNARITRNPTMRKIHEVEEYQVDFDDSSCREDEEFDLQFVWQYLIYIYTSIC